MGRKHRIIRGIKGFGVLSLLVILFFSKGSMLISAAESKTEELPRILFISSYDYDWESVPKQLAGFCSEVEENANIEYIFMDTKKHAYEDVVDKVNDEIESYIDRAGRFDLAVLGDDAALDYALEYRNRFFEGIPLVFYGINNESRAIEVAKDPLITGVVESFPMKDTIELAKQINPLASKVVAIADQTESGIGSLEQYYNCEEEFPDLEFSHIDCSTLSSAEIQRKIRAIGNDTILLFLMMTHDADGNIYSGFESVKFVTTESNVPVYKADELGVGQGFIGGQTISYEEMGALAGEMAVSILNGTNPDDILVTKIGYSPLFDEEVLKKFDIRISSIPKGSTLLNHKESFWEEYHQVLIPLGVTIFFLLIMVIISYRENRRRKILYEEIYEKDALLVHQQKKREHNYKMQMSFLAKINKGFIGNYRINVTQNMCEKEHGYSRVVIEEAQHKRYISDFITCVSSHIVNESQKEEFVKLFDCQNMLHKFMKGQTTFTIEHQVKGDDEQLYWYTTTAVLEEDTFSSDVIGYLYIVDISRVKIKQLLNSKSISQANERQCCIDVNKNTHVTYIAPDFDKPLFREDSRKAISDYFRERCYEWDIDDVLTKCNIDYAVEVLEHQDDYTFYMEQKPDQPGKEKLYIRIYYSYLDCQEKMLALFITDITDIHKKEMAQQENLERALEDAKAADQAKSEFISRMSHDMRTPLNAIISLTSKEVLEGADERIQKKYLKQIHISGKYLLGIINNVLDMSKISSDKITLKSEPYTYKEFIDTIESVIKEQCIQKNIAFHVDVKCAVLSSILTDKVYFNQIFINLLSNAVKFTNKGGRIDFIIEDIGNPQQPYRRRLIVKDNGIGMSKEFLPRAFESFEQEVHSETEINNMGTGLGLAIVQKLVSLLDGTIKVESELGKGTTFIVEMDLIPDNISEPTNEKQLEVHRKEIEEALMGRHILLFEDHPINAMITKTLLEKKGCIVEVGENGEIGLELFENSEIGFYDAILMDIRMPVMNGIEATRRIRALDREDAQYIPIIALTANAYAADEKEALDAGMNSHLGKPVDPQLLYQTLKEHMK